ncbi:MULTISPECIES: hypothetical protein [Pseudomonas]|uniref:Uncharacterized protein n=1 Tax=Pseudomonas monteilii SB3101 TaxID=1435058 RepID=V9V4J5_9PSED|nr:MULTISPECIES: hypothetical protein [Pseudomonas]AHC83399.1 hypothetical protein X969_16065 [Pseudomonas monteilii SB3078]AHC88775.1 hypothetical protein X970_15710 [Pseudomonas monteilii SB3101]KAF4558765.1 hypothetical protein HBJ16_003639 [Pseudomonas sp. CES]KGK26404.1 hypothetical protein GT93_16750 [Pseudomonas plecoglossicida]
MPEEKQLIQPLQVERDEYGFWTHPAWPDDGDECALPFSWFGDQGLEYCVIEMENDGPEELNAEGLDAGGDYDCTPWQPSKPVGDGWFTFSIHDTEDGPVCVWIRHKVAA